MPTVEARRIDRTSSALKSENPTVLARMRAMPRRYETGDLDRLRGALSRAHGAADVMTVMHPGDLTWAMFQSTSVDPFEIVKVWDAGDDVGGFALVEPGELEVQVLERDPIRRRAMLAGALDVAVTAAREAGSSRLRTECFGDDAVWADLLADAGFVLDEQRTTSRGEPHRGTVRFAQNLAATIEPPSPRVRAVGDAEEWPARVEIARTVWAPSSVTLESYARLRSAPGYDAELDLVAVDDGVVTSYAIVWYDEGSGVGEFEPVGTHPDHRRRGAARAVMLEGLRRLRQRGARRALVMSSADNPASLALYRSVGFVEVNRTRFWRLDLT
jgi:ribosomal protein S18 acetylase RimI-like enzyme